MSLQREILSPVTTAGMLYPALHTLVIQIAMPKGFFWIKKDKLSKKSGNMVARSFFQPYTLTASKHSTQFCCQKCGKTFKNKKSYAGHMNAHSPKKHTGRFIECQTCHKLFYISPKDNRKYCSMGCRNKGTSWRLARSNSMKQRRLMGFTSWNKGLTKENSPLIVEWSKKLKKPKKITEKVLEFRARKRQKFINGEIKAWNKGLHGPEHRKHYKSKTAFYGKNCFKTTEPERILFKALKKEQIPFKKHYGISIKGFYGFFTNADCIILPKERKIAIYVDGDYWHSFEHVRKRDIQVTKTLIENRWTVLRFSETELRNDLTWVTKLIKTAVEWDSSITFPKQSGSPGAVVDEVAEGAGNLSLAGNKSANPF